MNESIERRATELRFVRCLGCGEVLHSEQSQLHGAGAACRERLGEEELARRRARVVAGERTHIWLAPSQRT